MAEIELRYFGNSAFELTSEKGLHVVIDPCLTGVQGRGVSPFQPSELSRVDLILISHGAGDHLGDTLAIVKEHQCLIFCGAVVAYHLRRSGIPAENIHTVAWGARVDFKGISIRSVEAHHASFLFTDDTVLTGLPMGFIINTESGLGVYHAGDTSIFRDLELFGQLYKPQIGILPVGAFPGFDADLPPEEAALVAKWMKLKVAIPMHFPWDSTEGEQFVTAVSKEAPETRAVLLKPGQSFKHQF